MANNIDVLRAKLFNGVGVIPESLLPRVRRTLGLISIRKLKYFVLKLLDKKASLWYGLKEQKKVKNLSHEVNQFISKQEYSL